MNDKDKLSEALSTLANELGIVQHKKQHGLNLKDNDSEEIQKRNVSFTNFVNSFVEDSSDRAKQQKKLRYAFFVIIMLLFSGLSVMSCCIIFVIAKKEHTTANDIVATAAAFGTVLSLIVVLPKIIAVHLFPSVERDKSVELFSKVLEEDFRIRTFYMSSNDKIDKIIDE